MPRNSSSQQTSVRRKGIQSVEIGVGVLDAVVRLGAPAGLTDIARASGMSTSQAHRYLASFVNSGLLRQDAQSGLYDMAAGAIRIGLAAMARLDIFAEAGDLVQKFVDMTGRTALITVWGEQGPTVIRWYAGNPPVFTTISIGSRLPLTRSATGRVFLAFMKEEHVADLQRAEMALDRATSPVDINAVKLKVREAKMASISNDLVPGLRAIAVPVFDIQKQLTMVVTTIASNSFDPAGDAAIADSLLNSCRELTQRLGGSWPS
ncbi:transcriptional regulator, IclR family [Methylocella silvestris BL2]|uniref:Transcriptional regulator, IclR family n=1 Tax=Methylocella silvestris (strain DSM 15510 / CIP 108128 / LMG 27833 / NCIMB 13906 / BL2) TaxID=395965 RepID=B8EST5_METSB|nr:IclR family transcriptional regulator [Methylocella silvestris]ACK50420.1 transcriptional regulator, IclR family [Methylocella silvestris BL2]